LVQARLRFTARRLAHAWLFIGVRCERRRLHLDIGRLMDLCNFGFDLTASGALCRLFSNGFAFVCFNLDFIGNNYIRIL
ncbi:MAG: hypothetical protein Q9M23_03955, partial [Mariprofundaceae bacterium]|nr:hypothetical protein [Mariprofundaceae bacterium]